MSLTTMTRGRSLSAAMLLIASQAMPPVSAPSPMTATVRPVGARPQPARLGDAVRPRQAVEACEFDDVVLGLGTARSRTGRRAVRRPVKSGAREQLVDVRLVPGVEDDRVAWAVEDPVQAMVSSTTPRLGPRWPPVLETESTRNERISSASWPSWAAGSALRSAGPEIDSSRPTM